MADNEKWQGDDEIVGHSVFGGPITRRRMREYEEEAAKAKVERDAKAAIAAMTLPEYGTTTQCTKCGSLQFKRRYCEGETNGWSNGGCETRAGKQEHMHITCRDCKYVWYEHVLNRDA